LQQTPNYALKKIDLADSPPDITVMNPNWDKIDQVLKEIQDAINSGATDEELTLLRQDIGDKTTLLTTNKTSIVAALNELFTNASNGKVDIANAITGKGVAASGNDTFAQLANKISQIATGKKWAMGVADPNPSTYMLKVTGLSFKPTIVLVSHDKYYNLFFGIDAPVFGTHIAGYFSGGYGGYNSTVYFSDGFEIKTNGMPPGCEWVAIEF
jgi:hypothetical protein